MRSFIRNPSCTYLHQISLNTQICWINSPWINITKVYKVFILNYFFGYTKVSAKNWTAGPEQWEKTLSTCFSYSMCSYKTVKVHRLHWSWASGMEQNPFLDVCFESFGADMTPIKQV